MSLYSLTRERECDATNQTLHVTVDKRTGASAVNIHPASSDKQSVYTVEHLDDQQLQINSGKIRIDRRRPRYEQGELRGRAAE